MINGQNAPETRHTITISHYQVKDSFLLFIYLSKCILLAKRLNLCEFAIQNKKENKKPVCVSLVIGNSEKDPQKPVVIVISGTGTGTGEDDPAGAATPLLPSLYPLLS